ncbi:MAG: 2-oxoacid:acceptor oxidoreductase family protein [Oscillospiraceae bacterium]|nr:2-oxoacid:acceptor oxidoreductase family protein [Oscillospiraceae bacterium]
MGTHSIILAGFGGQGILFAGKQLALTGMYLNKKVTWMPAYGAEMRGGTSNCTVMISDAEVGSPVSQNPETLIAMNLPSYLKFHDSIAPGGNLFCDSSLVEEKSGREDIKKYYIPATTLAYENSMAKSANVIMLGKLVRETGIFTLDELVMAMEKSIPASRADLLAQNIKALNLGFEYETQI